MSSSTSGTAGFVAKRWLGAGDVAINTNWFANDINGFDVSARKFSPQDNVTAVKHTLQIIVPTETVVTIKASLDGFAKDIIVNNNNAIVANVGIQFDLDIVRGMTYNVQHSTGSQNVAIIITESMNTDI